MDTLPQELLELVADYLLPESRKIYPECNDDKPVNIQNFRLASKACAAASVRCLITHIVLGYHEDSIYNIREEGIARSSDFRPFLKTLVFNPARRYFSDRCFEEWYAARIGTHINDQLQTWADEKRMGIGAVHELSWGKCMELRENYELNVRLEQIRLWDQFKKIRERESCPLSREKIIFRISRLLQCSPNMKNLLIHDALDQSESPDRMSQPCPRSSQFATERDIAEAMQFWLCALASVKHRVESLTVVDCHWAVCADDADDKRIDQMCHAMEPLKEVRIGLGEERSAATEWTNASSNLGSLLLYAHDLETLKIGRKFGSARIPAEPFLKHHWPKLSNLFVSSFSFREDQLVVFIRRHQDTLSDITFAYCHMVKGTWKSAFKRLAGKFPQLRRFRILGQLSSKDNKKEMYGPSYLKCHTQTQHLLITRLQHFMIEGGPLVPASYVAKPSGRTLEQRAAGKACCRCEGSLGLLDEPFMCSVMASGFWPKHTCSV